MSRAEKIIKFVHINIPSDRVKQLNLIYARRIVLFRQKQAFDIVRELAQGGDRREQPAVADRALRAETRGHSTQIERGGG